ncbi:DedA family protein [uncultured Corynebacterium sp.]|uniref:DedA family protein n=1 Tax=uncultured Corynebacterium sp. TaxID=159447 RepID=UPI00345BE33C
MTEIVDSLIGFLEQLMTTPLFYPLLSLVIMLDALCPLMPSETVLNLAGAFSGSQGVPDVRWIFGAATIGAIIGDNLCFMLGGRLIGVVNRLDPESRAGKTIKWVRANQNKRAGVTIIVARFLPWARWVATIVLGSVRYNWFLFFIYDTIGVLLWVTIGVGVGYIGGSIMSDYPLLAMIVGVTLGSLVGLAIQKLQTNLSEWNDVRRGTSVI